MTTPLLTEETIAELTRDIWTALLADEDGLLPTLLNPNRVESEELAATIEISGAWNGTACLSCSTAAGRRAAAVMFDMEDGELSDEDVTDAVGELINVVGGNLKSLLPGPTELSLPKVQNGIELSLPGHLELAHEVNFSWTEEPVIVTVWTNPN